MDLINSSENRQYDRFRINSWVLVEFCYRFFFCLHSFLHSTDNVQIDIFLALMRICIWPTKGDMTTRWSERQPLSHVDCVCINLYSTRRLASITRVSNIIISRGAWTICQQFSHNFLILLGANSPICSHVNVFHIGYTRRPCRCLGAPWDRTIHRIEKRKLIFFEKMRLTFSRSSSTTTTLSVSFP